MPTFPSETTGGRPPSNSTANLVPATQGSAPAPPPAVVAPNGTLTFQGRAFNSSEPPTQFNVLAGEKPPTITDGYAKFNTVDRPLGRGATIFGGYNPAKMSVDVRFGVWDTRGWATDDNSGRAVEQQIGWLEWMAGVNQSAGPPPIVYVRSFNATAHSTHLIPFSFQNTPWVIEGIDWTGQSWRNPSAYRIYQEATVSLLEYLGYTRAPSQSTGQKGGYVTSKAGVDTPLAIASTPSERAPAATREDLARRIMSDPHNKKLKLRSIRQKIRHGTKVFVPSHTT
jgi:hypothetical protein